jgi:hypothetical protein
VCVVLWDDQMAPSMKAGLIKLSPQNHSHTQAQQSAKPLWRRRMWMRWCICDEKREIAGVLVLYSTTFLSKANLTCFFPLQTLVARAHMTSQPHVHCLQILASVTTSAYPDPYAPTPKAEFALEIPWPSFLESIIKPIKAWGWFPPWLSNTSLEKRARLKVWAYRAHNKITLTHNATIFPLQTNTLCYAGEWGPKSDLAKTESLFQ